MFNFHAFVTIVTLDILFSFSLHSTSIQDRMTSTCARQILGCDAPDFSDPAQSGGQQQANRLFWSVDAAGHFLSIQ